VLLCWASVAAAGAWICELQLAVEFAAAARGLLYRQLALRVREATEAKAT
jgi:hypothetical protein